MMTMLYYLFHPVVQAVLPDLLVQPQIYLTRPLRLKINKLMNKIKKKFALFVKLSSTLYRFY